MEPQYFQHFINEEILIYDNSLMSDDSSCI